MRKGREESGVKGWGRRVKKHKEWEEVGGVQRKKKGWKVGGIERSKCLLQCQVNSTI